MKACFPTLQIRVQHPIFSRSATTHIIRIYTPSRANGAHVRGALEDHPLDGAWLVLAYAFRSVLDAVLAGIWKGLGLDGHLKTIEEATRDGVKPRSCSCCKDGGKAAVLPAESPADNKPTPEERKRKDEEEEAQIGRWSPAALEREWRAVTTHDFNLSKVSWEQALAMSRRGACRGVAEATVRFLLWHTPSPPSTSRRSSSLGRARLQRFFGGAVAVREALYLAVTVACTVRAPAVFLIDVVASWQGTRDYEEGLAVAYVLAPEKVIFIALGASLPNGGLLRKLVGIALLSTVGTDLRAILAIAAALHSASRPRR